MPIGIPAEKPESVSVTEKGELLTVTCRIPETYDQRHVMEYLDQLLEEQLPGFEISSVLGVGATNLWLVVHEAFGNFIHHCDRKAQPDSEFSLEFNRATGAMHIRANGYVSPAQQERFGIKFQVAESLTSAQAAARLEKYEHSEHTEDDGIVSITGQRTAGLGLMVMRACAEGPMRLTFYPDQKLAAKPALHRYSLEVDAVMGRQASVTKPEHQGKLHGFFPHIQRGK